MLYFFTKSKYLNLLQRCESDEDKIMMHYYKHFFKNESENELEIENEYMQLVKSGNIQMLESFYLTTEYNFYRALAAGELCSLLYTLDMHKSAFYGNIAMNLGNNWVFHIVSKLLFMDEQYEKIYEICCELLETEMPDVYVIMAVFYSQDSFYCVKHDLDLQLKYLQMAQEHSKEMVACAYVNRFLYYGLVDELPWAVETLQSSNDLSMKIALANYYKSIRDFESIVKLFKKECKTPTEFEMDIKNTALAMYLEAKLHRPYEMPKIKKLISRIKQLPQMDVTVPILYEWYVKHDKDLRRAAKYAIILKQYDPNFDIKNLLPYAKWSTNTARFYDLSNDQDIVTFLLINRGKIFPQPIALKIIGFIYCKN